MKLHHYEVRGCALDLRALYLTNRAQKVDVNDMRSSRSMVRMEEEIKMREIFTSECEKWILIKNKELELVDTTENLGLTLDIKLQWGPRIGPRLELRVRHGNGNRTWIGFDDGTGVRLINPPGRFGELHMPETPARIRTPRSHTHSRRRTCHANTCARTLRHATPHRTSSAPDANGRTLSH
ncbi:hypothetical protein EVAR_93700_1 [Eumeta japonica]|uniref:Uncharacterized protein n=1 Tax=Eumeta variegata TaxID=151549 RepID=A0A4C1U436_EUMVA|nr:hypothetical protein EVAR_93700_1 [Eumeta japonica]